jgi:hypothetical protein
MLSRVLLAVAAWATFPLLLLLMLFRRNSEDRRTERISTQEIDLVLHALERRAGSVG